MKMRLKALSVLACSSLLSLSQPAEAWGGGPWGGDAPWDRFDGPWNSGGGPWNRGGPWGGDAPWDRFDGPWNSFDGPWNNRGRRGRSFSPFNW
jgi:hypothetical protein